MTAIVNERVKPTQQEHPMTNFIPNAVSTEDLKKAMEEAKSRQEVLMHGMSIGQLFEFLEENDLNMNQFGNDAPIIDKFRILIGLDRLKRMHSKIIELKRGECDQISAALWESDAEQLNKAMALIRGVNLGPKDISYSDYEEHDDYLNKISEESLDVLQHFGLEAPARLNQYRCAVEKALRELSHHYAEIAAELAQLKGRSFEIIDIETKIKQLQQNILKQ